MTELALPVSRRDHIRGTSSPLVTLVEYGDYECPYCGRAYHIVKRIEAEMEDKLAYVFRNFPLTQIHPHAMQAACAAEAAGFQGEFWSMHDQLFTHQDALGVESIATYGTFIGLDTERFLDDMESDLVERRVREDFLSGVHSGVNGTPTFFINGHRHDHWYEYQALRKAIEAAAAAGRRQS
jgi:protein-disulfide isomerase